jgi:hypothetical protein
MGVCQLGVGSFKMRFWEVGLSSVPLPSLRFRAFFQWAKLLRPSVTRHDDMTSATTFVFKTWGLLPFRGRSYSLANEGAAYTGIRLLLQLSCAVDNVCSKPSGWVGISVAVQTSRFCSPSRCSRYWRKMTTVDLTSARTSPCICPCTLVWQFLHKMAENH